LFIYFPLPYVAQTQPIIETNDTHEATRRNLHYTAAAGIYTPATAYASKGFSPVELSRGQGFVAGATGTGSVAAKGES